MSTDDTTIKDKLREMVRVIRNRERATKAAATRQKNALEAYRRESRAKASQARYNAKVRAQRQEHARQMALAFPEAAMAEPERTGKRGRPRVKVYKEEIGRIRKGVDGTRFTHDRHGRVWTIIVDDRGWTAYGPQDVVDGSRRRAIIRKGSAAEIRDAMHKAVLDIERYMNRGNPRDWKHFDR